MPRQGHRKSRAGCLRCKQRKIKCSEIQPVCHGCRTVPHQCIWPETTGTRFRADAHSQSSPTISSGHETPTQSAVGPSPPYADDTGYELLPDRQRRLELLLLSHWTNYTVYTYPTLSLEDNSDVLFNLMKEGLDLALEHDFLLNLFFALSALHLAIEPIPSKGPNHDFDFSRVHRLYLNKALQEQRAALAQLGPHNASALFWFAILSVYVPLRGMLPEDRLESTPLLVRWLTMSAALRDVFNVTYGTGGNLVSYINNSVLTLLRDEERTHDYNFGQPFRALIDFEDPGEVLTSVSVPIYTSILAYISKTLNALTVDREPPSLMIRRINSLGSFHPKEFVTFVAEERPRALAILAHAFALMKAANQIWWFKGIADREVPRICASLPDRWQWAAKWPLEMLETCERLQYHQDAVTKRWYLGDSPVSVAGATSQRPTS